MLETTLTPFSAVAQGTRAIHRVSFALIRGAEVTCGIRILMGVHDDAIETAARAAAIARGVADPKAGEPIYDRWVRLFTLLYSCVQVPEDKAAAIPNDPPLFFDGGVEQIQLHLERERIAYLFSMQEQWQALVAPRPKGMNRDEYMTAVVTHALAKVGEDDLPFWRWHPALQESFLLTTCALLLNSPVLRSASGSSSDSGSTSTTSQARSEAGDNLSQNEALGIIDQQMEHGEQHATARAGRAHAVSVRTSAPVGAPPTSGAPARGAAKNKAKARRRGAR